MAISHAGVLPAQTTHTRRSRLLGWIPGGALAAVVVAVVAIATWPMSESEKARADDLATQAADFRSTGSDVRQAFWDGYETATEGE